MTANDIVRKLAQLALPVQDYVVHTSASLVLRGILEGARDIDIVARGAAWQAAVALAEAGGAELTKGKLDQKVGVGDDIEIYDGWLGETNEEVIARAEFVNGVPCAPLADIVAFKQKMGRPKDLQHLEAIRAFVQRQNPPLDLRH